MERCRLSGLRHHGDWKGRSRPERADALLFVKSLLPWRSFRDGRYIAFALSAVHGEQVNPENTAVFGSR